MFYDQYRIYHQTPNSIQLSLSILNRSNMSSIINSNPFHADITGIVLLGTVFLSGTYSSMCIFSFILYYKEKKMVNKVILIKKKPRINRGLVCYLFKRVCFTKSRISSSFICDCCGLNALAPNLSIELIAL